MESRLIVLFVLLLLTCCRCNQATSALSHQEEVYLANQRKVDQLNRLYKDKNVTFALNQFAYMTEDEFRKNVLMSPSPPPSHHLSRYTQVPEHLLSNLPDSFDWREKGVVTSVKNQGSVGSCWAFSTVGNLEGQWAMAGNTLVSLSAEQLVDCDATFDPSNDNMDCGVFGGWPYLAYQYVHSAGGIEPELSYPYCSGSGQCYPCAAPGYNATRCGPPPEYCNKTQSCNHKFNSTKFVPGLKVASWVAVSKNETLIAGALVKLGPLSVAFDATMLQFYHSGVWDPWVCSRQDLDHAVLLVGYGTDKSLLSEKPYWLVKNSWGEKWGEDGYFRIVRGQNKCGIADQVTTSVLEK